MSTVAPTRGVGANCCDSQDARRRGCMWGAPGARTLPDEVSCAVGGLLLATGVAPKLRCQPYGNFWQLSASVHTTEACRSGPGAHPALRTPCSARRSAAPVPGPRDLVVVRDLGRRRCLTQTEHAQHSNQAGDREADGLVPHLRLLASGAARGSHRTSRVKATASHPPHASLKSMTCPKRRQFEARCAHEP